MSRMISNRGSVRIMVEKSNFLFCIIAFVGLSNVLLLWRAELSHLSFEEVVRCIWQS